MAEDRHHEELTAGIAAQNKILLTQSEQAVYIYLDDTHKVCNKKFADLLGYKTPKAWADKEAPLSDVIEADQQKVVDAYMAASEKGIAGSVDVRMKNIKTGKAIKTRMIIAPVIYEGHIFTIHYISKV